MKYANITLMCILSVVASVDSISIAVRATALIFIFVIGVFMCIKCSREEKLYDVAINATIIKLSEQDLIIAEYRKKYPLDETSDDKIKNEIEKISQIIENGGKEKFNNGN